MSEMWQVYALGVFFSAYAFFDVLTFIKSKTARECVAICLPEKGYFVGILNIILITELFALFGALFLFIITVMWIFRKRKKHFYQIACWDYEGWSGIELMHNKSFTEEELYEAFFHSVTESLAESPQIKDAIRKHGKVQDPDWKGEEIYPSGLCGYYFTTDDILRDNFWRESMRNKGFSFVEYKTTTGFSSEYPGSRRDCAENSKDKRLCSLIENYIKEKAEKK